MSQESRQLADESAVTFIGATDGASFQINDSEKMLIGTDGTRFSIESGAHMVKVFRDRELIAQRKIYASPGQTVEVRVR